MSTPPGYGQSPVRESDAYSGTASSTDPTAELGQTPASLFGVMLPQGTGAPGTDANAPQGDPTNEPGQVYEGISGEGPDMIAETGAPGSSGAQPATGGADSVKFTDPGSYLGGTYETKTVSDNVSGPGDWTQAIDGSYGGGGPQLPGIKGNEPTSTGSGSGRVMRGGRSVG